MNAHHSLTLSNYELRQTDIHKINQPAMEKKTWGFLSCYEGELCWPDLFSFSFSFC